MKADTKQRLKRLFSMLVVCAIVMTNVGPYISAQTVEEDVLKEQLEAYTEEFPEGAFEFYETAQEGAEGNIKEIVIIRKGGLDNEATVEFKAVDVSAVYGEDYLLTVKDGWFSTTLKSGTDGTTIMEQYDSIAAENTETSSETVEGTDEKNVFESSGELKWNNTFSSPLSSARDKFLGTTSSVLDWQEVTEKNEETEEIFELNDMAVNEYARNIMGTGTTLHFDEGEYKKVIQVELLDDTVGESDEQICFFIYDATVSSLGDVTTAYINIKDNDEKENSVYEMAEAIVYAETGKREIKLTIRRTSGTNLYGTVNVYTEDNTAIAGTDYEKTSMEVVFPQGVAERTITIPVNDVRTEGVKEFYVKLATADTGKINETFAKTSVVLPCSEDEVKLFAAKASDVKVVDISYDGGAASAGGFNASSGKKQITKSGMDLRAATAISFDFRSNEGSRTYEEDCDEYTAYGRTVIFYLGTSSGNCKEIKRFSGNHMGNQNVGITLDNSHKQSGMHLYMEVITTGQNNSARAYVTSTVKVSYPRYSFMIINDCTVKDAQTGYKEVKYIDGVANTTAGWIQLGKIYFSSGEVSESKFIEEAAGLKLNVTYGGGNKNSQGIAPSNETVEFKGYKLKKSDGSFSAIISPSDIKFDSAFVVKYREYMTNNSFNIYPVFEVKERKVVLGHLYYAGTLPSSTNNKNTLINDYYYKGYDKNVNNVLTCKALDTVTVTALMQSTTGESVETMLVDCINVDASKELENVKNYAMNLYAYNSSKISAVKNAKIKSTSEPNVVTFTPENDGVTVIKAQIDKTLIEVSPLPGGKNLGTVNGSYIGGITTTLEDGTILAGDPSKPMNIVGVRRGKLYKVASVVQDGYRTYWYDSTADLNNDGTVTVNELVEAGGYSNAFQGVVGSGLAFEISKNYTKIQYDFIKITSDVGTISGQINVKEKEIFTGKETSKEVEGALITIEGTSTTTDKYGIWSIEGPYSRNDYVLTNVSYGGIRHSFLATGKNAFIVTLDAFDMVAVTDAYIYEGSGSSYREIKANMVENKDATYGLVIQTEIDNSNLIVDKAILRFYDSNGVELSGKSIEVAADIIRDNNGNRVYDSERFTFEFNPSTLQLPAGTTMKVQFFDNEGIGYYNHETGIKLNKSLGNMVFANRFGITSNGVVNDLIGAVASKFNLDLAVNFADSSTYEKDNYIDFGKEGVLVGEEADKAAEEAKKDGKDVLVETISTATIALDTISYGNDTQKKNLYSKKFSDVGAAYTKLAEGQKEAAQLQLDLNEKSEAYAAAKSEEEKAELLEEISKLNEDIEAKGTENQKLEENAKATMDKAKNPSAVKTEIALGAYVTADLSMMVSMAYDDKAHDYYFKQLVLIVDISGGLETKFVISTPIGLDVTITVNVGLESIKKDESGCRSIITIRQRQDLPNKHPDELEEGVRSSRIYMAEASENDVVNLLDFDMDDENRTFDMDGIFRVSPKLGLACKVEVKAIKTYVQLSVTAAFDLYFFTDKNTKDYATLTIGGSLEISILGLYKKTFDYTSDAIDISGNSARATYTLKKALEDNAYLYDSTDTLTIRKADEEASTWQGKSTAATYRMLRDRSAATTLLNERVLKTGVFEYPDVQIESIGNGKYLAVFLDYDTDREGINQTAVYYTIYDNGVWAEPKLLEDDGTVDDSPVLENLGDKGIMVAWSTADRVLEADADVITTLSSRNIHTVLFDKESMSFGEIKEATKTTSEDNVADVNPSISYFKDAEGNEQMFMYYTKSEYERTDGENGLIGDAIYPYSLCAFIYYDFENDAWTRSYSDANKQAIMDNMGMDEAAFAEYEANWYGQGFLDVAPKVYINESIGDDGYWTEEPELTEISGDYSLVTSVDVITYGELALVAYVLDYDGTAQTINDRDVYLQIYDYLDGKFTHPVMITSDDVEDANVGFYRTGNEGKESTYLAWISDGDIKTINISHAVRESLTKAETSNGQEYYYIEKTANKNYMPIETIISADTGKEDDTNVISEFDVKTTGKYTYILWSDSAYVHADEANGIEASVENQLYACRYDSDEQKWTGRIALTDEAGANYTSAAFAVKEDGNLLAMASKGMSKVVESEGADSYATEDVDGRVLVGMDIVLEDKTVVKIDDFTVEDANAGETTVGNYSITNGNFETIENLTIQVVDGNGNVVNSTTQADLLGGNTVSGNFDIKLPEDAKTVDYTLNVLDKDGNLVASKDYKKELSKTAALSDVSIDFTDSRETLEVSGIYTNTGEQYISKDTVELKNGEMSLGTIEIPRLAPEESYEFKTIIAVKEAMFVEKVEADGAVSERFTLNLNGTDKELSVSEETYIERYASASQMEKIHNLTELKYESLSLTDDGKLFVYDAVCSEEYKMTDTDIIGYDLVGLNVQFVSDNDEVAYMNEYGVLYGRTEGTANVDITVMPMPEQVYLVDDFVTEMEDNYVTLPSAAIVKSSIPVKVTESKTDKPVDDDTDKPSDSVEGDTQTGDNTPIDALVLILCASCVAFFVSTKKNRFLERKGN